MQRSLLLFENAIKSKVTLDRYVYYLKRFQKFYHLKDYDSIIGISPDKLQIMIEDYVMDLKKRVNPNSVSTYVTPIQTFLEVNDLDLKWKKINRLFPAKIKATGRKAYTTEDIQKMLDNEKKKRNRALIHVLASTGARKGAIPDLQIKHLKKMPDNCYAVLFYEDSIEEYCSFLTPEASLELDLYLEERKNNGELLVPSSPLFRKHYQIGIQKVIPINNKSLDQIMERIVNRINIREKKSHNRYDKMLEHAFRKRFETIMKLNKDIPIAVAEKMIGHKSYFDDRGNKIQLDENYVVPEINQLFEFFKLAIPQLTIDDKERNKIEIENQNKKITEFQITKEENKTIRTDLEYTKMELKKLTKAFHLYVDVQHDSNFTIKRKASLT